jgi:transposase-like protein
MSFRKISPEDKLEVIQALWGGSNYNQLSKKYRVPRATIYNWEKTAIEAITNAFQQKTPGKHHIGLKEENKKLKEQLQIMYHDKHSKTQTHDFDVSPLVCEHCRSSHLKKNGTVVTKKHGLKQRYTCVDCSLSVYVELKKTLPQQK